MGTIRPFHSASLRLKSGKRAHSPGHALELHSLAAEQNRAGIAGAEQLALRHLDQMGMVGPQAHAAQLAAFERPLAPRKLAQRSEAIGGFRKLSCTHNFNVPNSSAS